MNDSLTVWAKRLLIGGVLVGLIWVCGSLVLRVGFDYFEALEDQKQNQIWAENYLRDKRSACRKENADYRSEIGPFDQCIKASRILASRPTTVALYELLVKRGFCMDGKCMVWQVDILGFLGIIASTVMIVMCLAAMALSIVIIKYFYRNLLAKDDLGTTRKHQ